MRPAGRRLCGTLAAAAALALASGGAAAWISGKQPDWTIAALVAARTLACLLFRLDRLHWKGLGFRDALAAVVAFGGGSALAAAFCAMMPVEWPARLLAADLVLYPALGYGCAAWAGRERGRLPAPAPGAVRTVVWGAGIEGRAVLERLRRGDGAVEAFGWIDDNPALAELDLDGAPVLGPLESLPLLVEVYGVRAVIIAIPGLCRERRELAEDLARWSGARLVIASTLACGTGAPGEPSMEDVIFQGENRSRAL